MSAGPSYMRSTTASTSRIVEGVLVQNILSSPLHPSPQHGAYCPIVASLSGLPHMFVDALPRNIDIPQIAEYTDHENRKIITVLMRSETGCSEDAGG